MKQLELNLQKRLLIVEAPENFRDFDYYELVPHSDIFVVQYIPYGKNQRTGFELPFGKYEFICKGSELTEDIAKDLVKSPDNFQFLDAENTFIGEIEKHGYYWGENPIINPDKEQSTYRDRCGDVYLDRYQKAWNDYKEAESKTFDLNKTLIFEILL